jgi:hypothetical protein
MTMMVMMMMMLMERMMLRRTIDGFDSLALVLLQVNTFVVMVLRPHDRLLKV